MDKKPAKPEPEEQLEEQRDIEQYPAGLPNNEIDTDSNETDTDNDGMPQKYNVELDQEMLHQATSSYEKLQKAMATNMYSAALEEARSLVHYLEAAGVR